jgi:hypothetical protein
MALFVVYAARRSVAKQFAGPFSLASCSGRAVRTGDAHLDTRLGSLRWFYAGHRRVGTAFLSAIATPRSIALDSCVSRPTGRSGKDPVRVIIIGYGGRSPFELQ